MEESTDEPQQQPRKQPRSQRKPASQAKLRMEAMANSVDHKIAAAFTVILLMYATITLGTWVRLESDSFHAPVLREAVTERSVVGARTKQARVVVENESEGESSPVAEEAVEKPRFKSTVKADEIPDIPTLQHTFPVHAGHDMEEIDHPGVFMGTPAAIEKTQLQHPSIKDKMMVPKFWRPIAYGPEGVREFLGEHGKQLITPEEASQIGSFSAEGLETLYISIASYRDPECQLTVEDMFSRADHPERMRVAIIDQLAPNDPVPPCDQPLQPCHEDPSQSLCKYRHLIDRFEVPAILSVGPVFARHLSHR
jgi:hypothetical protein